MREELKWNFTAQEAHCLLYILSITTASLYYVVLMPYFRSALLDRKKTCVCALSDALLHTAYSVDYGISLQLRIQKLDKNSCGFFLQGEYLKTCSEL